MLIIDTCSIAEQNLVKETCSEQCALKSNISEKMGNSVKRIKISEKNSWFSQSAINESFCKAFSQRHQLQWRIQTFPEGYAPEGDPLIYYLATCLLNLHENERIWTEKRASLAPPSICHWTSHCIWVSFRNGLSQLKPIFQCEIQPIKRLFSHIRLICRWPSGLFTWQDVCDDLRCLNQYRQ